MPFSEKLKELRLEKGLTQAQLADEFKITKRTVINYEAGRSYPSVETLYNMASFFKVRGDFLMDTQDEFVAEAQTQGGTRGRRGAAQLIEQMRGMFAGGELSENDKDAVMQELQEIYWEAKKENKKYTPKKYREN